MRYTVYVWHKRNYRFLLRHADSTNWTDYYYRKNLQGDVTHIVDVSGVVKAEYIYDAWGNCTITTDVDGIANLNPIRYRGYYYDSETGLYYLKSRYYDPETGRFISPALVDNLDYMQINGLNLYTFGLSNPISVTGNSSSLISVSANGKSISSEITWPDLSIFGNVVGKSTDFLSVITGIIKGYRDSRNLTTIKGLNIFSTILMGVGIITDMSLSIYDNFTASGLTWGERNANMVGDLLNISISQIATWGIAFAAASIPVVGWLLAPIAGIATSQALSWLWDGKNIFGIEPLKINGKTISQHVYDFFKWLFGG